MRRTGYELKEEAVPRHLKIGISEDARADADAKVRRSVEDGARACAILAAIEARGDAAVRECSERFDGWSPEEFRLSRAETDARPRDDGRGRAQLAILPTGDTAGRAWRDYGQVIVCDGVEEMVAVADGIAAEHVQTMTEDPRYFLDNLTNYGALFLGPETRPMV